MIFRGGFLLGYNQKMEKVIDVANFLPVGSVGQTVGVPGFLAGLWSSHQRHGRLAWRDLIMPSVNLARWGLNVFPIYPLTIKIIAGLGF